MRAHAYQGPPARFAETEAQRASRLTSLVVALKLKAEQKRTSGSVPSNSGFAPLGFFWDFLAVKPFGVRRGLENDLEP